MNKEDNEEASRQRLIKSMEASEQVLANIVEHEEQEFDVVSLLVLDQYWCLIEYEQPSKMSTSINTSKTNRLECCVDIEAQNTAKGTLAEIKRYISTHYYDGEFTIKNMCKL